MNRGTSQGIGVQNAARYFRAGSRHGSRAFALTAWDVRGAYAVLERRPGNAYLGFAVPPMNGGYPTLQPFQTASAKVISSPMPPDAWAGF
jgi:hypothetical protein